MGNRVQAQLELEQETAKFMGTVSGTGLDNS